jgi:hypothetical protein
VPNGFGYDTTWQDYTCNPSAPTTKYHLVTA